MQRAEDLRALDDRHLDDVEHPGQRVRVAVDLRVCRLLLGHEPAVVDSTTGLKRARAERIVLHPVPHLAGDEQIAHIHGHVVLDSRLVGLEHVEAVHRRRDQLPKGRAKRASLLLKAVGLDHAAGEADKCGPVCG